MIRNWSKNSNRS